LRQETTRQCHIFILFFKCFQGKKNSNLKNSRSLGRLLRKFRSEIIDLTFELNLRFYNLPRWVVVTLSSNTSSFCSTLSSFWQVLLSLALVLMFKSTWQSTWTSSEIPTWTPQSSWSSLEPSCLLSLSLDAAELVLKIPVWCIPMELCWLWFCFPWSELPLQSTFSRLMPKKLSLRKWRRAWPIMMINTREWRKPGISCKQTSNAVVLWILLTGLINWEAMMSLIPVVLPTPTDAEKEPWVTQVKSTQPDVSSNSKNLLLTTLEPPPGSAWELSSFCFWEFAYHAASEEIWPKKTRTLKLRHENFSLFDLQYWFVFDRELYVCT